MQNGQIFMLIQSTTNYQRSSIISTLKILIRQFDDRILNITQQTNILIHI